MPEHSSQSTKRDSIFFFAKEEFGSISSTLSNVFSSSSIAFSEPPIIETGPETIMAPLEEPEQGNQSSSLSKSDSPSQSSKNSMNSSSSSSSTASKDRQSSSLSFSSWPNSNDSDNSSDESSSRFYEDSLNLPGKEKMKEEGHYKNISKLDNIEREETLGAVNDDNTEGGQRAIDPVTGEINWDCPCLKEAVAPPCGEFFKAAFSCFVKSSTEPKGEDCLDDFIAMQECYLSHPEIYRHKYHGPEHESNLEDLKENIAVNLEHDTSGHYLSESASLSS